MLNVRACAPLLLLAVIGCSSEESSPAPFDVPARNPGAREPLSASCDALDSARCLLPWPSNVFTTTDTTTPTGLRLAIDSSKLYVSEDDAAHFNLADGFSRVSPLMTGFAQRLAPDSVDASSVVLLLAQHDHPRRGERVPVRVALMEETYDDVEFETLLMAFPLRPLEPGADYVAVLLDDVRSWEGAQLTQEPMVKVALGLAAPISLDAARQAHESSLRQLRPSFPGTSAATA